MELEPEQPHQKKIRELGLEPSRPLYAVLPGLEALELVLGFRPFAGLD